MHAQGDRLCLGKHEVRKFIPCYVKVIRMAGLDYVFIPPLSPNEESVHPIHVPFFANVIVKLPSLLPKRLLFLDAFLTLNACLAAALGGSGSDMWRQVQPAAAVRAPVPKTLPRRAVPGRV
jgi:hypothetical protein